jgi:hypothetical protein
MPTYDPAAQMCVVDCSAQNPYANIPLKTCTACPAETPTYDPATKRCVAVCSSVNPYADSNTKRCTACPATRGAQEFWFYPIL